MSDAIGLEPRERVMCGGSFLTVEEFEATQTQITSIALEVVPGQALAKGRCCWVWVIVVRCIVLSAQAELPLCCNRRNSVRGQSDFSAQAKVKCVVELLDPLRQGKS